MNQIHQTKYNKPDTTTFVQLSNIFINYIMIMMRFNDGDRRLCYKLIYCYCISFVESLLLYLSVILSGSVFCNIIQASKQYFNNLHLIYKSDSNQNTIDRCIEKQLILG